MERLDLKVHVVNGIKKLFWHSSFANIDHFLQMYDKYEAITNDGIDVEKLESDENDVYKLTFHFGDITCNVTLIFRLSGIRLILDEVL
jgi:hypothetical protein